MRAFPAASEKRPLRTTSGRLAWRRRHSCNHARKRERGCHASVQVGATDVADRDGARAARTQAHRLITRRSGGHAGDTIFSGPRTASRAGAKLRRLTARHAECIPRVLPRQKALICRHFPCRRRDSNPRHADYDSAALGSTARFEGAGGHERGHIRTAGPPARSGLVLAFALRPKQPSFARGSALRSRPQRARREPQRRRLRSPRASARTTSAGTTAFAFETCDVGPRRGPRHPARPSRHRRQIEL
jgi:hypothetical protein